VGAGDPTLKWPKEKRTKRTSIEGGPKHRGGKCSAAYAEAPKEGKISTKGKGKIEGEDLNHYVNSALQSLTEEGRREEVSWGRKRDSKKTQTLNK